MTLVQKFSACAQKNFIKMNTIVFFYNMPQKFQIDTNFLNVSANFSLYTKIILFFYHMTQKISGLLKNFRIAMLPCYWCFPLSALHLMTYICSHLHISN